MLDFGVVVVVAAVVASVVDVAIVDVGMTGTIAAVGRVVGTVGDVTSGWEVDSPC